MDVERLEMHRLHGAMFGFSMYRPPRVAGTAHKYIYIYR